MSESNRTSNLVTELKWANERGLAPPQNWTHRAIEEIERLTAELETERMCHISASNANHDNRAERDRLRAKRDKLAACAPVTSTFERRRRVSSSRDIQKFLIASRRGEIPLCNWLPENGTGGT